MEKNRAAKARDTGGGVVIDLDNEIVEVVVTSEPIATVVAGQSYRPIVMAAGRVFAPAVLRSNGANRQESLRPRVTVGAPPQSPRPENASGRPAIALALVRQNTSAPKRNREYLTPDGQPSAPGVTGCSAD
jgi:hypothetical protein